MFTTMGFENSDFYNNSILKNAKLDVAKKKYDEIDMEVVKKC